jgi:hypothetical protein
MQRPPIIFIELSLLIHHPSMPLINGYTIMDDSYYIETRFHIPSYSELHTQPEIVIHPNSATTQLGLTPAELAPVLREQQEY